jgi:predicted nucleotidyltransferase
MDKWFKILNEARREPSQQTSKAQRRYKAQRRKNDIYTTTAGHKNLSSGAPFTTKPKRFGTDRLRFEEVEPESFEKQVELNPKFWQDKKLKKNIFKRLMKIAREFLDGLNVELRMEDLRFTGSLANYNWSKYSDIDLHIVVDFSKIDENTELVKSFFDNARMRWNDLHDITIYGAEVEIYVENVGDIHKSSGIYSLTDERWIVEPTPDKIEFDYVSARKKADSLQTQVNLIDKFAQEKPRSALKSIDRLKEKIRRTRRAGLSSPEQEYSAENIAFKILRREETLDKLNDMKYDAYDRILSIGE